MPAPSPPGIEETSSEGATEEGVSLPRPPQPSAQGYLRVRAVRRVFISRGGCVVGGLWAEPAEPAKPWALEDRGAVLWSVGWRLTPLTVTVVRQERRGPHKSPDSQLCTTMWEEKDPSTFAFSFMFPSFSLWMVFCEDFLSAWSEDSSLSSLTDTVELSEILRALGISGTWN